MTAREAADTIREALKRGNLIVPALAALDVLVAAAERADTLVDRCETAELAFQEQKSRAEAAEARADTLEAALREAIDWIEDEDPYEDPHDEVRQRFIAELLSPLAAAGGEKL